MRKRTHAREVALKILYQADISHQDIPASIENIWHGEDRLESEVLGFCNLLVTGTSQHFKEIDNLIAKYATNWQMERMAVIDRNILRLATFELLFLKDVPVKVTINEAVELAKKYGDLDSGKFVNGILDKINKTHEKKCQKDL